MPGMTSIPVKTRFAPSPTGKLHLGNLRTALFNVLLARRHRGCFLLRIEDSDLARNDPSAFEAIAADLRWLGLDWDEGPGRGESHDWQQSARAGVYAEAADQLLAADAAYWCFCSQQRLAELRASQARQGQAPRYDGCCTSIDPQQARERKAAGEPAVLRLRMPQTGELAFEDLVRGHQRFPAEALGDPVIQRADGTAAFLFANAVDDGLMGVTHVLRGEDHLSNTPRQQVLLARLGLTAPVYGHVSLVIDAEGAPLSKRSGSAGVAELHATGYRPEALLNYLARLGNAGLDDALLSLDELARDFDPGRLAKSPARFDRGQLDHWQSLAMAQASTESLLPAITVDCLPTDRREGFIQLLQPNIQFADELNDWAQRLFADELPLSSDAKAAIQAKDPGFFAQIDQALAQASGEIDWQIWRPKLEAVTGFKGGQMMKPLRFALTGLGHGPALGAVINLMAPETRRARLVQAQTLAGETKHA